MKSIGQHILYAAGIALMVSGCSVEKPAEIVLAESQIPDQISFSLHVKPILSDRCYSCHGPDVEGKGYQPEV